MLPISLNDAPRAAWLRSTTFASAMSSLRGVWRGVWQAAVNRRAASVVGLQLCLVVVSNYLAFWLRFDGAIPSDEQKQFIGTVGWLLLIRGTLFIPFRLHEGLWEYAGIRELRDIILSVASSTATAGAISQFGLAFTGYSHSVFLIDAMLLIALLSGLRFARRLSRHLPNRTGGKRVLIVGAGDAGEMIVRDMQNRAHEYEPIGFVDDDPRKLGQHIHGVPVMGSRRDLPRIVDARNPHEVLVAIPSASAATIQELVGALRPFKVPITTLPSIRDILDGRVAVGHIRSLTIQDLLPRAAVNLETEPLRALIAGRNVLITGAAGSIGGELSRQIAALGPATLVLYDRYENTLHDLAHELVSRFGAAAIRPVIGDVTDPVRVHQIFERHRPHIVFHAAAYKHVPLMEDNPCEAVKNNVVGTHTMTQAAAQWAVERFILISTDKAVNPTSVMGATKYVGERIVRAMSVDSSTHFATVRFGNVLGSNGSVLPRFLAQVEAGGPVTVTHPEIRRYFMLIPEAVHLVLHAAALDDPAGTYILDMGEQIKVVDLARDVIRLAGFIPDEEIRITFVGLRPGEKLFEELVGAGETAEPSPIPKILRVRSSLDRRPALLAAEVKELVAIAANADAAGVIQQLRRMVPAFEPCDGVSHPAGSIVGPPPGSLTRRARRDGPPLQPAVAVAGKERAYG